MYIEKNNKAQRTHRKGVQNDVHFLLDYYEKNGRFPLFSQVLLETRTDCNRKCRFCPQYHAERPKTEMRWKVYQKVIDDLKEMGFAGRVALFMTNEPLLESRIFDMLCYAKEKSPRFFLDITTNGNLLTVNLLDRLLAAGLDNININDYRGDRENKPDKVSRNLEEVLEVFRYNPKVTLNPRCTRETLSNYAGVISSWNENSSPGFCNYPFRKFAVAATGNIILCCNDYHYTTDFGSVLNNRLTDIWHSEPMNQYRLNLLRGIRDGLCAGCDEEQHYDVY